MTSPAIRRGKHSTQQHYSLYGMPGMASRVKINKDCEVSSLLDGGISHVRDHMIEVAIFLTIFRLWYVN